MKALFENFSLSTSIFGNCKYKTDIKSQSDRFVQFGAKDLDQSIYVAFVYRSGTTTWNSGVLGYSIGAYCNTNASTAADVAPLAQATAVYGYHAKQLFYKEV